LQTQGCKISSNGKLSLLTGWFNHHKEGYHCYFIDENCYRVEGHEINRSFRKSKEQLKKDAREIKIKKDEVSLRIDELLKTNELRSYFELKEELSCLNAKLSSLCKEIF